MISCTLTFSLKSLTLLLGIFSFHFLSFGVNLKRFDAPPVERPKYLSFKSPSSLRFASVPMEVDRLKLIPLDTERSSQNSVNEVDSNETETAEFPIVTYSTETEKTKVMPTVITPLSSSSDSLPLADPFEGVSGSRVGTTDELLNVFEEMNVDYPDSIRLNTIPFIPPYTVAPDNLKIGTKATYRRVPR